MLYKYETHLHTSDVSVCAHSSAEEMVLAYQKAGYTGIIVTDHFITMHQCIPDGWSWEKKMLYLYSGFENAAALGANVGLDVFFGWEMTLLNGEDYLTYNLSLDFLLAHPEIAMLPLPAYSKLVRGADGLLVRAHPFRQAYYLPRNPTVRAQYIDGVEVNNGVKNDPSQNNSRACAFAAKHPSLFCTSGSDVHHVRYAGSAGMAFDRRFDSIHALADAMRRKEGWLIVDGEIEDAM